MPPRRARPSARRHDTLDPLQPLGATPREAALGGAAMAPPVGHIERGTVIDFDAARHVYRVALNSGRTMLMSRLRSHPGDLTMLPNGTMVVATFALGLPYIMGVLPPETSAPATATENPISISDVPGHGGEDPVLDRNFGATARADGEPRDVLPGDFVGLGPDGASVGALHGKVAQLRASPLAKVQAFGDNDLVQIIAGVFRLVTWMGESRIVNDDGKTSFVWRGGADQLTQTGPDEGRYTIRFDAGHTGDLVRLEVTNREGQAVFRFHVDPQGRCELYAAGGFDQHAGADGGMRHPQRFHGSVDQEVAGAATRRVTGEVTERHEAGRTEEVATDHHLAVGQDQVVHVNRDQRLSVGGDATTVVTGTRRCVTQGDCTTEVRDGHLHGVKTFNGEARVETQGGRILLDPATGIVEIPATSADAIRLGAGASVHATRWEELNTVLTTILGRLNGLSTAVATHVHPAGAPSTGPSPTLAPYAPPINPDVVAARSHKVKLD